MRSGFLFCALAALALSSLLIISCRKEKFIDDPSAKPGLSADSILFDTVFTTLGSVTKHFMVYNAYDETIVISSIVLEGGSSSNFRIAVDGMNGTNFSNVEILPGDSIFVFVEVTVDPGNSNDPFVIEDKVRLITNGNEQHVILIAWGQDAYFHGGIGGIHELSCDMVWGPDKPHIIYGILMVGPDCSLTILPGTHVYVHAKSGLWINEGRLFTGLESDGGNASNRVIFSGDRLEPFYDDIPGQWGIQVDFFVETGFGVEVASVLRGGIWVYRSPETRMENTELHNGSIGIQVDTSFSSELDVVIRNVIISNMSAIGLLAQQAHIRGENILVENCGQACAAFTIGGKYDFRHCTFANYWIEENRTVPAFVLNNYYQSLDQEIIVRPLELAEFHNCIMWGNNHNLDEFSEFVVDLKDEEMQSYFFGDCIVDIDQSLDDASHFVDMSEVPPLFVDPYNHDFHISASGCQPGSHMYGTQVGVPLDLDDIPRGFEVNIGCYDCQ